MPAPEIYRKAMPLLKRAEGTNLPPNPYLRTDLTPMQTNATAWLYQVGRGLLADPVGSGKTVVSLALLTYLKKNNKPYRAIILAMNYASQRQWEKECLSKTSLIGIAVDGTPTQRKGIYSSAWEVLIVRYSTLLRDAHILQQLNADVLICDEPSAPQVGVHHHNTQTAQALKELAASYPRVVLLDATPMQSSPLLDLHGLFEVFAPDVFPERSDFDHRYVKRETQMVWRGKRKLPESRIVGWKRLNEFKTKIKPYIMRRKDDSGLPDIVHSVQWFSLPKEQREHYEQAKTGVLRMLDEGGVEKSIDAYFHHLQYACDSTIAFDDPDPTSVKLDWLVRQLQHGMEPDDKVVVFSRYKSSLNHIVQRLQAEGISVARLTGDETKEEQGQSYDKFRDGDCRVLVGTTVLERALNLQVAKYLVAFNQIYNPGRMIQLAGRVRRKYATHKTVYVVNLLTEGTVEGRMYAKMQELAQVPDFVFDEETEMFDILTEDDIRALLAE